MYVTVDPYILYIKVYSIVSLIWIIVNLILIMKNKVKSCKWYILIEVILLLLMFINSFLYYSTTYDVLKSDSIGIIKEITILLSFVSVCFLKKNKTIFLISIIPSMLLYILSGSFSHFREILEVISKIEISLLPIYVNCYKNK